MSENRTRAEEGAGRRRTGLLVVSIPVALFALSAAFIALQPPDPPSTCRHDHPDGQVRTWWEKAMRNEVTVPGTRYVALDDPVDGGPACIRVGLEDRRAQTHLERRFHRLGIPREVVVYGPAAAGPPEGMPAVVPPTDSAREGRR